jgi:pyruvate dehydrogenase E2 component (dihydrolipoamide acetyltransferase)
MVESAMTIPQFSVRRRVDMSAALTLLDTSNQVASAQMPPKQTSGVADILHFVVTRALRAHPQVNASFELGPTLESSHIVEHENVDLGIAVALPEGLVVPVIRDADKMSLQRLTEVRMRLQNEAQRGRLPAGSLGEATFTVSNLGTLGADDFIAIVNPPEAAILAVGRVQDAVVVRNGSFQVAPVVMLSVTADHRILDGAQVAQFLQTLSEYLAEPEALAP